MKRYEHLTLGKDGSRLIIETTDLRMAEAIIHEVEQRVGRKLDIIHLLSPKDPYTWELKMGYWNSSAAIYITSWLCRSGWEPYAVDGGARHFRRELPPEAMEAQ